MPSANPDGPRFATGAARGVSYWGVNSTSKGKGLFFSPSPGTTAFKGRQERLRVSSISAEKTTSNYLVLAKEGMARYLFHAFPAFWGGSQGSTAARSSAETRPRNNRVLGLGLGRDVGRCCAFCVCHMEALVGVSGAEST